MKLTAKAAITKSQLDIMTSPVNQADNQAAKKATAEVMKASELKKATEVMKATEEVKKATEVMKVAGNQ